VHDGETWNVPTFMPFWDIPTFDIILRDSGTMKYIIDSISSITNVMCIYHHIPPPLTFINILVNMHLYPTV
jgi:hypothetical protein